MCWVAAKALLVSAQDASLSGKLLRTHGYGLTAASPQSYDTPMLEYQEMAPLGGELVVRAPSS